MTNPVPLNPELHKSLRIVTERGAKFGDDVHIVDVFPSEFRSLMAYYPVVFSKSAETGRFVSASIFGFEPGENLFVSGDVWDAPYVPLNIRRQPFYVQAGEAPAGSDSRPAHPIIALDTDSKRIQLHDGEALFQANGEETEFLKGVHEMLARVIQGSAVSMAFSEKLQSLNLIEQLDFDIKFDNGTTRSMQGLYIVSEEKLRELPTDDVVALHASGYLGAIYAMIASLSQIGALIVRKNRKIAGEADSPASNRQKAIP